MGTKLAERGTVWGQHVQAAHQRFQQPLLGGGSGEIFFVQSRNHAFISLAGKGIQNIIPTREAGFGSFEVDFGQTG